MTDKKDEIDFLYKNLDYLSNAYLSTQSAIFASEAIYALVVGQLLIGYFDFSDNQNELIGPLIIIAGSFLSMFWFALFPITLHYQNQRISDMNDLEEQLKKRCPLFSGYTKTRPLKGFQAWHITQILPFVFSLAWLVLSWIYLDLQNALSKVALCTAIISLLLTLCYLKSLYKGSLLYLKKKIDEWWLPPSQ